MPRIAILNILIGFTVIFISASAGTFLAYDITEDFVRNTGELNTWKHLLLRSSHGHFNLFGMIQVLFGLSLPYSLMNAKIKHLQTMGLTAGTIAMGPVLFARAYSEPTETINLTEVLIGVGVSLALLAIALHMVGLANKYRARS